MTRGCLVLVDLLFSTLELNIGFASLSTGSVVRLSRVGLT
jgi:hypothetical protein